VSDETKQLIRDLLRLPKGSEFLKLGYLRSVRPSPAVEFFNGLLVKAIEARASGDWSGVEAYLDEWERRVEEYTQEHWYEASVEGQSFAPLAVPLAEATVGLITTGGLHLANQEPFDVDGDHSFREIPLEALPGEYLVSHKQYDTRGALEDYNCIFAVDRLREAAAEGRIGRVAETNYSFMGYIPDWRALVDETAPEVARRLKEAGVHAVVIGTT
jgi:D-proline reductase (dithiol) PrdB